jgi:hypothetical protein
VPGAATQDVKCVALRARLLSQLRELVFALLRQDAALAEWCSLGLYVTSFFKDLQFLLIGPLWLLAAAYPRFSVPY